MIELDDLLTQRNKINLRFHTKTLIGRSEALLGLLYQINCVYLDFLCCGLINWLMTTTPHHLIRGLFHRG